MRLEELQGFDESQMEQIKKVIQSETDSVRTQYSKRVKELEQEVTQYKPKEKTPQEIELEQRIKVLEDREKAIQQQEKQVQLQGKLKEKGLDSQLYKFLNVGDDADNFLDEFAQVINKQLLDGSYKPHAHKDNKDVVTKEQFSQMGYMERVKLQETNPSLYNKLCE